MNVNRSEQADARRFRWLLAGNGDFMEEMRLCCYPPCSDQEQDDARAAIDAEMAADESWGGADVAQEQQTAPLKSDK